MATSFEDIYCLNSVIRIDERLNNKPSYQLYELYWKYLQFAIAKFQYDCRKNLLELVPFSLTEYSFKGDGVNNIFELNPAPTPKTLLKSSYQIITEDGFNLITENGLRIVTEEIDENAKIDFFISSRVNCSSPSREIKDYVFDSANNTITFLNYTPIIGEEISITAYQIGYFAADLNYDEKIILAEGMNIPYYEEQLTNSKILNFATYGGSIKMHSQAEQLKNLNETLRNARREWEGDISNYGYRTAPVGLFGLGARTVCLHPLRYKPNKTV